MVTTRKRASATKPEVKEDSTEIEFQAIITTKDICSRPRTRTSLKVKQQPTKRATIKVEVCATIILAQILFIY